MMVAAAWTVLVLMTVAVAVAELPVVRIRDRERHARHVRVRAGVILCVTVGVCMCVDLSMAAITANVGYGDAVAFRNVASADVHANTVVAGGTNRVGRVCGLAWWSSIRRPPQ